ncbi:signal peptidase I [Streptomyces sp. MST-110588]|uniref:signal peptidase I n=1 Tax=Streptomyces sp. MST-110588 TaxID=2833628 RepID=UPI001F5DAE65|nr:signal peptidase I [Streptomyces sp. MST-110588]
MGVLAIGTREGHDGPEERQPGEPVDPLHGSSSDGSPDDGESKGEGVKANEEKREKREKGKQRSFWKELPILIGVALVLALLIKTFFVQAFSIPSDSMQNTLQQGDRVLVDKLTPWFGTEPERGEVVVFHDPDGWLRGEPTTQYNALQKVLSFVGLMPSAEEEDLIKRVIGVAGDTVECKGTGPVKVNGKVLDEPYVFPGNTPCSSDAEFKVTVPKDRIWVMGDHRQDSMDSRYHMQDAHQGMVPVKEVVGRAFVIAWPVSRWDTLPVPDTFAQKGLEEKAMQAASVATPHALALVGAVPLVFCRRRRRRRQKRGDGPGRTA